jgi:hypothetical protein
MAGRAAFAISKHRVKGSAMKLPAAPAVMVALSMVLSAPAFAAAEPNPALFPAQVAERFEDGELNNFVAAFVRMIGVQHGYMMLLQNEPDPTKAEELKASALSAMEEAIQQDGLTIDRYNQIATAVRDDPELQGRVEGILQQLAEEPAPADEPQQ